MSDPELKVVALCGSLRQNSFNRGALRAAQELAPPGMQILEARIDDLPLYNEDLRADGQPAEERRLKSEIAAADAILFFTPEYNYSVPGVLKNAIDWASRPPDPAFIGKPAAIVGASPGMTGTARAQYHLRQIGVFLDLRFLNKPEIMIGNAAERFDAEGRLTDQKTRELIGKLLVALRDWTLQLRKR